jgi:hypothetical protein
MHVVVGVQGIGQLREASVLTVSGVVQVRKGGQPQGGRAQGRKHAGPELKERSGAASQARRRVGVCFLRGYCLFL